jgi:ATP-binding cassette, subfamily B, bacterial PglK
MITNFKHKLLTIYKFLTLAEKKKTLVIFLNGFINLAFDLISIGLIIPIIYSIVNNKKFNIPLLGNFELDLYLSLSIFIFIIVVKNIFYYYNSVLLLKFCKNLYERISIGLLENQIKSDYLEYLKVGYSDFSRSILLEVNYLVGFYRGIISCITQFFIFSGILIFLFFYNFTTTISLIAYYFIFLVLPSILIYKKIDRLAKDRKFLDKNKIYISNHIFQNLSIIKLFKKELFFIDIFKEANLGQQNNLMGLSKIQLLPKMFIELTTLSFIIMMIIINIYISTSLEKMVMVVSIYLFAAVRLMPSINELMGSLQSVRYFYNSFVSVDSKITIKTPVHIEMGNASEDLNFKSEIKINNLSFNYPGDENNVINNLNFKIKKNSLFGIHGESGSGKTTLINILLGLISSKTGQVMCDNVDISKNINSWQNLISYVPSSYLLLNSTIKSNVAYGEKDFEINKDEVNRALESAQMDTFIKQNNINQNYMIEEDGKNLSAGQIQRICISRAFYRNTPILILDEPTSNLDKENAYKIISLIKSIKNLTTIIVSHDYNIIKMCDENIKLV